MEINDVAPNYEPKLSSRFYVKFPNDIDIKNWQVVAVNKPKFNGFSNDWEFMNIYFADPIEPSTSKELYKLYELCNNNPNKLGIIIHIETLDAKLNVVEDWAIEIGHIQTIDFGDLTYENVSPTIPRLFFKPVNCYLT